MVSLAFYSKKGEAWPLGHVVQQSWQKQALALVIPKLEAGGSEESILGMYGYVPARVSYSLLGISYQSSGWSAEYEKVQSAEYRLQLLLSQELPQLCLKNKSKSKDFSVRIE